MPVRIIRARDLARTPWKNGGGTTAEVAVHPPGAGFEAFDWRISMADVTGDGPFSIFPGIDRTLVLIEGAAIVLRIEATEHRLDAAAPILAFPGEAATSARLVDGPIRDLNVMTRRGRLAHAVALVGPGVSEGPGAWVAIFDETRLNVAGRDVTLQRLDTALVETEHAAATADRPVLHVRWMWPAR